MLPPNAGRGSDSGFRGRMPVCASERICRIRQRSRIQQCVSHDGFFIQVPRSSRHRVPNSVPELQLACQRRVPAPAFRIRPSERGFRIRISGFGFRLRASACGFESGSKRRTNVGIRGPGRRARDPGIASELQLRMQWSDLEPGCGFQPTSVTRIRRRVPHWGPSLRCWIRVSGSRF